MIYIVRCEAIGYNVYLEYKASSAEHALAMHKELYGDLKDVTGVFAQVQ